MYDLATRKRVLALVGQGRSLNSVSKETGISRAAIRAWQQRVSPAVPQRTACVRCAPDPGPPADQKAYVYLLGLYLGDGHIVHYVKHRSPSLMITCADAHPGLMDACEVAMKAVFPGHATCRVRKIGCTNVKLYSKHLGCLFPQHGKGRKHERPIVLEPWQRTLVDNHPWELVRGLIHSDGCRAVNRVSRVVRGERRRYEYPRYFFTNTSGDIIRLFTDTLDVLGVAWTHLNQSRTAQTISIARRASVALMDAHVGPKY